MIDRTKCYCDEADDYVREQMDGLDLGDECTFDVPPEMTHLPKLVALSDSVAARLDEYQFGVDRPWASYHVVLR